MVRRLSQQGTEILHRVLVVARRIAGIAQPEVGGWGVAALRVALEKINESHLGGREIPLAKDAERRFEIALLSRFRHEFSAIQRDLGGLELAQTLIHALHHVFLLTLQF